MKTATLCSKMRAAKYHILTQVSNAFQLTIGSVH